MPLPNSIDMALRILDGAVRLPKQLLGESGGVMEPQDVGARKQSVVKDWGNSRSPVEEEECMRLMLAAHDAFSVRSSALMTVQAFIAELVSLHSRAGKRETASSKFFGGDKLIIRLTKDAKSCAITECERFKYTAAIDIRSIGCIFAEVLTGKLLFPGKNVVHNQLDLITDLLGTPSVDTISVVRNEKTRRYLTRMRKKQPVPFAQKFRHADRLALRPLEKLLAFDTKNRLTAEEALADLYFRGMAKVKRKPSSLPISKVEFEFERCKATKDDIRKLIFREILEYHPQLLKDNGVERTNFAYPSAQFKKQFAHLEENSGKGGPGPVIPLERKHVSLPRSTIVHSNTGPPRDQIATANGKDQQNGEESRSRNSGDFDRLGNNFSGTLQPSLIQRFPQAKQGKVVGPILPHETGYVVKDACDTVGSIVRNTVLPSKYYPKNGSGRSSLADIPSHTNQQDSDAAVRKVSRADDRVEIDANLLQTKAQYGVPTNMASHRKAGSIQYGVATMY